MSKKHHDAVMKVILSVDSVADAARMLHSEIDRLEKVNAALLAACEARLLIARHFAGSLIWKECLDGLVRLGWDESESAIDFADRLASDAVANAKGEPDGR